MPESVRYGGALSVSNGPLLRFDRELKAEMFELATVKLETAAGGTNSSIDVPLGATALSTVAIFADQYEPAALTYKFDTTSAPVCALNQPLILTGGAVTLLGATAPKKVTLTLTAAATAQAITANVLVARKLP